MQGGRAPGEPTPEEPDGPLLRLLHAGYPFRKYLAELLAENRVLLSGVSEEWHSPMLHLARWVRAHPDAIRKTAGEAWKDLDRLSAQYDDEPDAAWKKLFGVNAETAEVEFRSWWDKVRSLPTADPVEYALQLADARPVTIPGMGDTRSKLYPRFVAACYYLQKNVGNACIFVPTAKFCELLGVSKMTVSRYRDWAVEDGFLKEVAPAVHRRAGKGLATSYRCLVRLV